MWQCAQGSRYRREPTLHHLHKSTKANGLTTTLVAVSCLRGQRSNSPHPTIHARVATPSRGIGRPRARIVYSHLHHPHQSLGNRRLEGRLPALTNTRRRCASAKRFLADAGPRQHALKEHNPLTTTGLRTLGPRTRRARAVGSPPPHQTRRDHSTAGRARKHSVYLELSAVDRKEPVRDDHDAPGVVMSCAVRQAQPNAPSRQYGLRRAPAKYASLPPPEP